MSALVSSERLLTVLSRHIGSTHGIGVRELSVVLTGDRDRNVGAERRVRKAVEALRLEGYHICAHPSRGYYLAADSDELTQECDFLRHRALTSLRQLSAMTHTSIPDLVGQMRFTT